MKELLFGWITKGQYNISFLDNFIAFIEIVGGYFLIVWIILSVKELIKNLNIERKNNLWQNIQQDIVQCTLIVQ